MEKPKYTLEECYDLSQKYNPEIKYREVIECVQYWTE
jgi:hypothetical protein